MAQRHVAGLGGQQMFPAAAGHIRLALRNREPVPMPERPMLPFGRDAPGPLFSDQEDDGAVGDRLLLCVQSREWKILAVKPLKPKLGSGCGC